MLRAIIATVILALAACATPASMPAPNVALAPGEGMTLELGRHGDVRVLARTSSPSGLSETERGVVAGIRGNPAAMGSNVIPMVADSEDVASESVEANRIKLRFLIVAPHDAVLMIENGYDQALTYRASISVNDRSTSTDVCLVLPSRHGVEHWPYLIDRIELSRLTLQPWHEGDPTPCG